MKQSIFFVCILWIAGLVACNGKDDDSAIPDTGSNINVFIAVPGGHFDVALDTAFIGTDLGEGESTTYKSFRAQRYTLLIYAAGNHTMPLIGGQISMRNAYHYSAFLSVDHTNTLRLTAVEDNLTPLPDKFAGKIRVVNLSDTYTSGAQSVNLDFTGFDLRDTTRFQNLNYLAVTPFAQIQAGSFNREIRLAGTTQSLLGKIQPTFTVVDGKFTSWVVYGNALVSDSFKLVEFTHN
jgi:hypothetical protein